MPGLSHRQGCALRLHVPSPCHPGHPRSGRPVPSPRWDRLTQSSGHECAMKVANVDGRLETLHRGEAVRPSCKVTSHELERLATFFLICQVMGVIEDHGEVGLVVIEPGRRCGGKCCSTYVSKQPIQLQGDGGVPVGHDVLVAAATVVECPSRSITSRSDPPAAVARVRRCGAGGAAGGRRGAGAVAELRGGGLNDPQD
jgi:hypothetical protein